MILHFMNKADSIVTLTFTVIMIQQGKEERIFSGRSNGLEKHNPQRHLT